MFANFPQGSRAGSSRVASTYKKISARFAVACAAGLALGLSLGSARATMGPAPVESPWIADTTQALAQLPQACAPAVFATSAQSQPSLATFIGHQADSATLSISLDVPTDAPLLADNVAMLPAQPSQMLALLSESPDVQLADAAGFLAPQSVNINAIFMDENSVALWTILPLPQEASTELFFRIEPMFALNRNEFLLPARREDEHAG